MEIIHLDRNVLPPLYQTKTSKDQFYPLLLHEKPSLTPGPQSTVHSFIQQFLRACLDNSGDAQRSPVLTAETF